MRRKHHRTGACTPGALEWPASAPPCIFHANTATSSDSVKEATGPLADGG